MSRDRIKDYRTVLPIAELYVAVQSEGSRAGYPTVVIRTTGCTHRCYFGEGGWCDSWQTSIHPEKGAFTFHDIIEIYNKNSHITEMMITGGSPTMHPTLLNELTHFASKRGLFITVETEGSHYVETDYPIDLLSISPKFSNSIPQLGIPTPMGKLTDASMIRQHEKFRVNMTAIEKMITFHKDYHIKPVWDGFDSEILLEIKDFLSWLDIPDEKVYFMPAGSTREALIKTYQNLFNYVVTTKYRLTWRPHIMAFDDKRFV